MGNGKGKGKGRTRGQALKRSRSECGVHGADGANVETQVTYMCRANCEWASHGSATVQALSGIFREENTTVPVMYCDIDLIAGIKALCARHPENPRGREMSEKNSKNSKSGVYIRLCQA